MEYIFLDNYCQILAEREANASILNETNVNSTTVSYEEFLSTENGSFAQEDVFDTFHDSTEWYLLIVLGAVGIAFNIILMVLLRQDRAITKTSRSILMMLLVFEVIFSASVIVFTQMRHFLQHLRMEVMTWVTIVMSCSQMMAIWLTYILVNQCFYNIKRFCSPCEAITVPKTAPKVCTLFIGCLLFHLPYVPYIQMLLNSIDPYFNPCSMPIIAQWDLFEAELKEPVSNLYFVLYYCLLYFTLFYGLPFFLIGCRDKDIIDIIHELQSLLPKVPVKFYQALQTGVVVSTICNVYMFLTVPKLLLLLLRLFDLPLVFVQSSYQPFKYVNVVANMMLVLKSMIYLPLFLRYGQSMKGMIYKHVCRRCYICVQKMRHHDRLTVCTEEH